MAAHLYGEEDIAEVFDSVPIIGPLTSTDTFLSPDHFTPKLLGIVSDWIDLCSPDPVIYNVSRQVLKLEVAFASFCGLAALSLPTPLLGNGPRSAQAISLYAAAIKDILDSSPYYMALSIRMPMMDTINEDEPENSGLAHLARPEYTEPMHSRQNESKVPAQSLPREPLAGQDTNVNGIEESRSSVDSSRKRIRVHDFLGSWDAWNALRTYCDYHTRLHVGTAESFPFFHMLFELHLRLISSALFG